MNFPIVILGCVLPCDAICLLTYFGSATMEIIGMLVLERIVMDEYRS